MDSDLKKLYKQYADDVAEELKKQLREAKKNSSGKLIRSIDDGIKETGKTVILAITAEKYLDYVDKGRKKGKFPKISALETWASREGIPKKAVWPIAFSIAKKGIKATNVVAKTLKVVETKYLNKFENGYMKFVETELVKILTNPNNVSI